MRHAWYVVSQYTSLDSWGLKGGLYFPSHWVIWGGIIIGNSKQAAVGKLKTIQHLLQMYG